MTVIVVIARSEATWQSQNLTVANATVKRFIARVTRLYEQEQSDPNGPPLLEKYVRRWEAWANGGLEVRRDITK